ncbi:hypothetical protein [Sporichthya polymorpha]|uniref:hypothetical protein n=1 Tax=Sporichthya polymorpha TaxID=35751 RepID=UPI00035D24A2|nr:hypothetical protein [Sporichthya polymorpha]
MNELLTATRAALVAAAGDPDVSSTDVAVTMDPAYGWVELDVVTSVGSGRAREDARRDLGTRVRWQVPVD